jgi:hypothetical protein
LSATFFTNATLDNLFIGMNQQFASSVTFTVFVNGAATALTCTIAANAVPPNCSDTTHPVSVTGGQTFSVHVSGNFPGIPIHFRVRMH